MWMGNAGLYRFVCDAKTASVSVKCRYESLIAGNPELVAEYKGRLFCFSTESNQEKFMRWNIYDGHKLCCSFWYQLISMTDLTMDDC